MKLVGDAPFDVVLPEPSLTLVLSGLGRSVRVKEHPETLVVLARDVLRVPPLPLRPGIPVRDVRGQVLLRKGLTVVVSDEADDDIGGLNRLLYALAVAHSRRIRTLNRDVVFRKPTAASSAMAAGERYHLSRCGFAKATWRRTSLSDENARHKTHTGAIEPPMSSSASSDTTTVSPFRRRTCPGGQRVFLDAMGVVAHEEHRAQRIFSGCFFT